MTLDEFRAMPGPEGMKELLERMDCETFTNCHERMREETGLWIPELVPVFAALDAMGDGERDGPPR